MPPAALLFELPLFGVAALLFVIAIPAAVVTAMKGRWIWFAAGFLTLGVVWVIAAIAIADPDSWWARTFYGEGRTQRAADPARYRRSARLVAAWIGGALAAVLVLGFVTARPSAVFGVSASALQNSVDRFSWAPPCEHRTDRLWACMTNETSGGTVAYRVRVNRLGCWSGTRVGAAGEESPKRLSGCVTVLDYVF